MDLRDKWGDFSLKMRDILNPNPYASTSTYSGGGAGGGGGSSWGDPYVAPTTTTAPQTDILMQDPYGVQAANTGNYVPTAPTASPVEQTAYTPTIGEQLEGIKTEALRIQDILNQQPTGQVAGAFTTSGYEAGPTYEELYGPEVDPDAEYRKMLKLHQAEIDATNRVYDQLYNQAVLEGQGRLGSQRAMAARGGLLGSDFAASQKAKVQDYNTDINRSIQAERTAAIGAILGTVRSAAQEEIRLKREARQQGAESYMDYLAGKEQRRDAYKNKVIQDMLVQGYDPTQATPEELQTILQGSGINSQDLIADYLSSKASMEAEATAADQKSRKTEAEIAKIEADIASGKLIKMGEGDMLYDPATGETFKNPKTYKPDSGTTPGVDKIYTTKDLPGDIRTSIIEDLTTSGAAQAGTLTVLDLMAAYPEVNMETLQEMYDNFYAPPEEDNGAWWNPFD